MTIEHIKMSIDEWIHIEDNPIQRNTEKHARIAIRKHLRRSALTHQEVSAVKIIDSDAVYKLDGHTRAYLWKYRSLVPNFKEVNVTLYIVKEKQHVFDLYKQFDNLYAAEDVKQKLSGIYHLYQLRPESQLIRQGALVSALKYIYTTSMNTPLTSVDIYNVAPPFLALLMQIDTCDFNYKKVKGCLLVVLLLSVIIDGDKALTFWRNYHEENWEKKNKEKCLPWHLHDYINNHPAVPIRAARPRAEQKVYLDDMFGIYLASKDNQYQLRRPASRCVNDAIQSEVVKDFLTHDPLADNRVDKM